MASMKATRVRDKLKKRKMANRIPDPVFCIYIILDLIGDGIPEEEIIKIYPDITGEDIKASLKFASMMMEKRRCQVNDFINAHKILRPW